MPDEIRYISKVGRDAWLRVRLDSGGEQSLPYALKVKFISRSGQRDNFEILEGAHKGKKASVSQKSGTDSYLVTGIAHTGAATIKFDRAKQAFWFGNNGPVNAFSGEYGSFTQVPAGSYALQIPFAPSDKTRDSYYRYTDYHKTWFRLGLDPAGSRFIHVGEISDGCITVRAFLFDPAVPGPNQPPGFDDLPRLPRGVVGLPYPTTSQPIAKWNDIYDYLIVSRENDQSVGKVVVV